MTARLATYLLHPACLLLHDLMWHETKAWARCLRCGAFTLRAANSIGRNTDEP